MKRARAALYGAPSGNSAIEYPGVKDLKMGRLKGHVNVNGGRHIQSTISPSWQQYSTDSPQNEL